MFDDLPKGFDIEKVLTSKNRGRIVLLDQLNSESNQQSRSYQCVLQLLLGDVVVAQIVIEKNILSFLCPLNRGIGLYLLFDFLSFFRTCYNWL